MNFNARIARVFSRSKANVKRVDTSPRVQRRRLSLEKMEDRRLMAVIDLTALTSDQAIEFVGGAPRVGVGDLNGDGYDEVFIGTDTSTSYLIFGRETPLGTVDLSNLGTAGIELRGVGASTASGVGDVNGDGFDDLAVGDSKTYIVFGRASLPATIDLTNLGINGTTISGSGYLTKGDFNGDGLGDLVIGELGGLDYVVFGSTTLPSSLSLDDLGTAGVTIIGDPKSDYVSAYYGKAYGAGDVNGDGFDDIVLGEDFYGHCFLIFGSSALPVILELDNLGEAGVTILPPRVAVPGTPATLFPSSAGDMNGDGFDDLIFMTFFPEGGAFDGITTTFVVLGKESITGVIDLSKPEAYAVKISGAVNHVGFLDSIGDINADGFDDIGLGFPGSVVFGAATMPSTIDLNSLGAAGIEILPGAGRLADAGDVNGDGFDDLAVSNFVVFGNNGFSSSVNRLGNAGPNTLTGTVSADVMVGRQGDDTLLGNGGSDVLNGGQGDDLLVVKDLSFSRIVGGAGSDTLRLVGSGLSLDLTLPKYNRVEGIETIDISGSGDNTLLLDYLTALNISDTSNTLVLRGNLGDRVNFASGWTQRANQVLNGETFMIFTQGKATLKVQLDIVVNQSPIITAFAGRVTATQGGPSITLDGDATLTDADSANFSAGTLTVEIVSNAEATDRLSIRSFGNTPGKIGVTGSTVKYGGVVIGTFTNTSKLVVTLNSSATAQATQTLIRQLTFSTTSNSTLDRTLRITLTDGNRGSGQASKTVHVIANNVAPQIESFGPAVTFNFPLDKPGVFVSQTALVTDVDTRDFSNAKLTIATVTNAQPYDILSMDNDIGSCCNAEGPSIIVRGVIVGYETGGKGTTPLVITFNANATAGVVQTVLRNVKWATVPPVGESPSERPRGIVATLTDGDGATSNIAAKAIHMAVVRIPPTIHRMGYYKQYPVGSPGVLVAVGGGGPWITPGYSNTSFAGAKLTITTILNGEATDKFFIKPDGTGVGQINVIGSRIIYGGVTIGSFNGGDGLTPLVVSFNVKATAENIAATLRRVAWKTTPVSPSTNPRTFSVTVSDSNGTVSSPVQKRIVLI